MAEGRISRTFPDFIEGVLFQIAQPMGGVLVEATRQHHAIPGDDGGVPEFPAVVEQFVFHLPSAVRPLPIAGIPLLGRYERVAIAVVVHLGGFQFDFIHSYLLCQAADFGNLVLVGPDDEELEHDVGCAGAESLSPCDQTVGAVEDSLKVATPAIGFINFLGSSIDGDDEAIEAGFDGAPSPIVVEEVSVGAGDGVYAFAMSIGYHVEKLRMDVGFALEIEDEEHQIRCQLIDGAAEEVLAQVARGSGECAQAAGAFGAAQVAGGGRLDGHGHGSPPLDGSFAQPRQVVGSQQQQGVGQAPPGHFSKEIQAVVQMHERGFAVR